METQNGTLVTGTSKKEDNVNAKDAVGLQDLMAQMAAMSKAANEALAETARLNREIAEERAKNEALRKQAESGGGGPRQRILKVSEKGGVTFNAEGIRRFGITLYEQEWQVLAENIGDVMAFVKANSNRLSKLQK